jgi:DNA-binding transcriptional LysR family regulator
MNLHHLTALLAIADKGSFTRGAKSLDISQSSLSHAIRDLERELGVTLFLRDRHGAHLTASGRRLLTHARQALASLDSMRAEADHARGILSGRVRIGSIPSATVSFLPKVIAHFGRQHPQIEVLLLEEPSQGMQQLAEWLRTDAIDFAIVELPMKELNVTPLIRDELCAIVSKKSVLAKRKQLTVQELSRQPFVMSRYSSERLVQAAYAERRVSPVVRFEVQDLGTLVNMVREGLGISIVPRVVFSDTPPGVVLVPVVPRIRRELGLALKVAEHSPPAVSAFVQSLQELSRAKVSDSKLRPQESKKADEKSKQK